MIELMLLAFIIIFSGIFVLKFLFFVLALLFSGVGFFLKLVLTLVFCVLIFPLGLALLGVLFSGGGLVFLLIIMGLGALISEKKEPTK
ncbi:hypothetical protein [Oceanispirochaeta sp.]|jgi:hypothetical protein|uniref:hypothetical protein n=1 Tax=Oceanispirochaeta sp. TaxID=2035350 RepID=UPI0026032A1C|nr:hypothetical protein [Oceanispirochaeta sp.]MDA3958326.1 hypothetical protein [Oceanispirochaeta sp.]